MGAKLNPADKRFSLTIISTHWFEKWSLALTSGRAGVWDEVQLTNLNLQNKRERKKYTLCIDKRMLYVTTDMGTTHQRQQKLQSRKEIKKNWMKQITYSTP